MAFATGHFCVLCSAYLNTLQSDVIISDSPAQIAKLPNAALMKSEYRHAIFSFR
ncbi:hypothetical protein CIT292_06238 [Citrobacter youngae ATCC 29220]|uniref:Uncharacterized protein n=1 Tax=Citrobacter youngae ATCC 29220 TaxID=500640 RepID=D4B7E2_9ENTR|nr:hypothetical protein CIT292_06238 [Citrobacter youngae ATCC 29220]